MPKWIEVSKNYDHRWPSGAVTALVAGTIVNVKDEVADDAIRLGAAKASKKPEAGDPRHETSGARYETDRAATHTATVVVGGFTGHPSREARAAAAFAEERRAAAARAEPTDDRAEDLQQTAEDAEALANQLRLEEEGKAKK
jgi:hypothetical protein